MAVRIQLQVLHKNVSSHVDNTAVQQKAGPVSTKQGLSPCDKNNLDAFLGVELSYMFTLWYKTQKNTIGMLHSGKLSFSSPCSDFSYSSVQSSTDCSVSVSIHLPSASWSTDRIKVRYFVYLVSDFRNTEGVADREGGSRVAVCRARSAVKRIV